MRLEEQAITEHLAQLKTWKRDGKWIERKYRFEEFMDAIEFVNQVAQVAESLNHHPMIHIEYKLVTLRLTSWHAGGLTDLDFTSAERYDQLYEAQQTGKGEAP
ncbi:transcriptional coactivator/pterin dehydratase [Caldalkalibacillus thermarum TA2.A1]|uniref:4a-hydroxytetrahydrobiopterin dehydratase n=1 Tax=Caldalkalibacillus thermarum (strain TA2.A1) TaxID=986075 RepID=F5L3P1_CALTT|nr:4a-hydroxytetrahydrobiopterin dehydratase [Caldalkalibacillus thermarum]EGL84031.1 transcriptional coactivator/pterin dehydratase [Caldalkalibacillus thermarum TA2.A1]QZT35209.1 4a-hydroxytetrahydrobiopterin dehydratase [Caldalkalibacillus thermarum TA2.A1]